MGAAIRALSGLLLLALGACAARPLVDQWQNSYGTVATVTDVSMCRQQARHQALLRYPRQPIEETSVRPRLDDDARTETEGILFRACMRQRGYTLMVVPSS